MAPPRNPRDRRRLDANWSTRPIVVDGYRPDGLPWPVETTRYAYVTPFGGVSEDLEPGTVGINRQAILENTALDAGDAVTITVHDARSPVPFMFRRPYQVVPLDFSTPDGYLHSVDGEAVLAHDEPDAAYDRLGDVREGVKLVLNAVLGRRDQRFSA